MVSSDTTLKDMQLVRMTLDGDGDAFNELYRRHREKVYGVAYHLLGSREDALDQVQEAFIRAHKALPNFKGNASFKTWLLRITTNRCLDYRRMMRRRRALSTDEGEFEISKADIAGSRADADPAERLETEELREAIIESLGELSESHRAVILMQAFQEMRYREIAEELGVSEGTVMSRLYHARRSLYRMLVEKGAVDAPASYHETDEDGDAPTAEEKELAAVG